MHELEVAWRELDDDPIGAGHREHRHRTRLPDRPRHGAAQPVDPRPCASSRRRTKHFELRFTAWHNDVWKPVIAAVNGVCAGGGLHFVADADIVIASDQATFVDPHVSVGQVSAFETIALAKKSPMEPVLRMALTGAHERVGAARAYELGICSQVVAGRGAPRRGAGARRRRSAATIRRRWPRPSVRSGPRSKTTRRYGRTSNDVSGARDAGAGTGRPRRAG